MYRLATKRTEKSETKAVRSAITAIFLVLHTGVLSKFLCWNSKFRNSAIQMSVLFSYQYR